MRFWHTHPKASVHEAARACGVPAHLARLYIAAERMRLLVEVSVPIGTETRHGFTWTTRIKPPASGDCADCALLAECRTMVAMYQAEAGCFGVLQSEVIE